MATNRQIQIDRGKAFARENGVKFLETSPYTNVNIEEAFLQIAESILDKRIPAMSTAQQIMRHNLPEDLSSPVSLTGPVNHSSSWCCSG